jgi:hypothetical protein
MLLCVFYAKARQAPREGECFIIEKSKSPKGGYIIKTAWTMKDILDGRMIIDYDVEPIMKNPTEDKENNGG